MSNREERVQAISQKAIKIRDRIDIAIEKLAKAVDSPTCPIGKDERYAAKVAKRLRALLSVVVIELPRSKRLRRVWNKIEQMKKRSRIPLIEDLLNDAEKWIASSLQAWCLMNYVVEESTEIEQKGPMLANENIEKSEVTEYLTSNRHRKGTGLNCESPSGDEDLEELPVIEENEV